MTTLLRRAWASLLHASMMSEGTAQDTTDNSELPLVHKLPKDLLCVVLTKLGAADLAAASVVCRAWHAVASSDSLWEGVLAAEAGELWPSVLFFESFLRPGFALRSSVKTCPLPFRLIHSQRIVLPLCIVIDGGSGYCKFGWGNRPAPQDRLAPFMEFGNIESPICACLRDLFTAIFARFATQPGHLNFIILHACEANSSACYAHNHQFATLMISGSCHGEVERLRLQPHSDFLYRMWMGADTEIALAARRQLRETTFSVLFELGVPAVCAVDQAVLALYAAGHTSGIAVNIGFNVTSIVPILHGKVMRNVGVEIVEQGSMHITVYLSQLIQQKGTTQFASMYTARTLKEKLCYVAQDFAAELNKDCEASCSMGQEGIATLDKERFCAPEILFQPRLGGLRTMGLQQAVALCVKHCSRLPLDKATDVNWFKTIVLAGGTACLPGLSERLGGELRKTLRSSLSSGITIIPPQGPYSAWFGAKLLSNLSTFQQAWCVTKNQFRQYGISVVHAYDEQL